MTTPFSPLAISAAKTIAQYHIAPEASPHGQHAVEVPQAEHRIQLVNHWRIPRGSRVLEIGCGQGTLTAVLAEAVGPDGHVDAVDPGSPDYGAPWTLGQAQAHLSAGPVGGRIAWHNAEPEAFLAGRDGGDKWDFVVLGHCIWYFAAPEVLTSLLVALRGRAGTLLIAEYALTATEKAAVPHVLASMARAFLEAHNEASEANIRCLLSPGVITDLAQESGWHLDSEAIVVPGEALQDGSWETGSVKSKSFLEEITKHVDDTAVQSLLRSSRDAVTRAVVALHENDVRTMDVWVARFR
ncbi:Histone-fold protein [Purpureocillium lavendulum]|uniref:Histone-fold protein n=1 Tax=Purpureocillium lavendulum TaxID=1247861 RepID=A0AB34FPJ4_9HYPO|nr:Histone-fold protein [Purpureocillium lavendulum]